MFVSSYGLLTYSAVACPALYKRFTKVIMIGSDVVYMIYQAVRSHSDLAFRNIYTFEIKWHLYKATASDKVISILFDTGVNMTVRPKNAL